MGIQVDLESLRSLYSEIFKARDDMGLLMNDVYVISGCDWSDEEAEQFRAIIRGIKSIFENSYNEMSQILNLLSKMQGCIQRMRKINL